MLVKTVTFSTQKILIFASMKATAMILAFYMTLGSCFPHADFSQLPKVIYAFQHFQQHQQEEAAAGRTTTFWQFVETHFFQPDRHPKNHSQEHNQLPLQFISSLFAAVAPQAAPLLQPLLLLQHYTLFIPDLLYMPTGFPNGIFRPPLAA